MEPTNEPTVIDMLEIKKNATYSLPISVWLWLKDEARRRNTDASAIIVELVSQERNVAAA